ncbi:MAG TPA: DOMON-like domain-containing protein [Caulobacteraceae bacterium]|nr:DOMON-like domain-containing protein [Caulobacteraceae bacterium]
MILSLVPHPDFRGAALASIVVEVARRGPDRLDVTYLARGRIGDLALPSPAQPARTDELWRRTCFEAFLRPPGGEAYLELNFAPSSAWAAYRFDAYRSGMAPAEVAAPAIETRAGPDTLAVRVALTLPEPMAGARLALSAVIEESAGAKSYWALAHPPGRPDFHADAGFAATLA